MAISISCCLLAVLLTVSAAQTNSYDFCNWAQFRAAVIRDQIWIDGGELWEPDSAEAIVGNLYSLNFSSPFDTTTTNLTALFDVRSKIDFFPTNLDPGYVGGTMFANNYEFYLFGGLPVLSNASTSKDFSTQVLGFELYNNTPGRTDWSSPWPIDDSTPAGMTVYVTDGAGVNVPSENLGFYFSGMQNPSGGLIAYDFLDATMAAGSLIEVDMSDPGSGKWSNNTLDPAIKPRANAQLAWVPVSTRGILVAVGGVLNPEDVFDGAPSSQQQQESKKSSPDFMKSIPVYDIGTSTWYLQPATGLDGYPPALSEFCSVLAISNDSSSFELYIYGGYDGVLATDAPSDDVWILSMPAFTWIKAYSGVAAHARSGHYCALPYPNTMFVIGGYHVAYDTCVDGGIVQVFDLNNLKFVDSYNPAMTDYQYLVPSKVSSVIGGDSMGGATKTADWVSPNLGALFNLPYPTPITTWYPYQPSLPPSVPGPSPHWLVPVIAVVIACFIITLIGLAVWYCIRRNRNKKRASGDEYEISSLPSDAHAGTRRWLGNVIRGMPDAAMLHGVPKSEPSVTTTEVDGDHNHVAVAYEVSGNSRVVSSSSPNNRLSNNNSVAGSSGLQRMPSERHDSSEIGDTRQAYEMYTSRSATELPAQYHDPYHPRSIDHAMDAGYAHHPPGAGISRFSNPGTSPELAASEDLNPVDVSPSLGGSHHPYSDPNSPNAQLSPEVELPPDNFATRGSSEHRPAHARNISSMSNLPSPNRAAGPEPLAGDVHPTQTFSQYQPDFNPEYVQDDPESSPRVQRANFNAGFGPDGQARSSSVLTRKPVGKAIYANSQLPSRPESGEAEYFVPYDGQ